MSKAGAGSLEAGSGRRETAWVESVEAGDSSPVVYSTEAETQRGSPLAASGT